MIGCFHDMVVGLTNRSSNWEKSDWQTNRNEIRNNSTTCAFCLKNDINMADSCH